MHVEKCAPLEGKHTLISGIERTLHRHEKDEKGVYGKSATTIEITKYTETV